MHMQGNMSPVVLSFGGGVNSTALLTHLVTTGQHPDLILWADTGSEWPGTAEHVEACSRWSVEHGGRQITVTKWIRVQGELAGRFIPLHEWCLMYRHLPSLATGGRGCSVKWKQQPQDKAIKEWQPAIDCWERGDRVVRLIGYDDGEPQRAVKSPLDHKLYDYQHPLIGWDPRPGAAKPDGLGWDRDRCIEEIERAGLPVPRRSACWCCPAMKTREIKELAHEHPDLMATALDIERLADERWVEDRPGQPRTHGLGGSGRRWTDIMRADCRQETLFADPIPCACWDL